MAGSTSLSFLEFACRTLPKVRAIASIRTTATAHSQTSPDRLASLDRPNGGVPAAVLWTTTATDIWICLYPTTLNSIWERLRNPVRQRTASILLHPCFVAPGDIPTVSTVFTAI